jgi:asparagine synthase (glutamine-hydrolysing)
MPEVPIADVVDLTDPAKNRIRSGSVEDAREAVRRGAPEAVRAIAGSFALVAASGRTVRLARSMDRPLRYFLAKRAAGPQLVVADRIDAIQRYLASEGMADQFHPSYTRMVPAHHVLELELVGCPDPEPSFLRFFEPKQDALPADLDEIGRRYVLALADEISSWLRGVPSDAPIGVCFSGGIDSGAVFLVLEHLLSRMGKRPQRLKAFTLAVGAAADLAQARAFLDELGLAFYLEPVEADPRSLDPMEAVAVIEDYKPLDVECATMAIALCRGIRERYPDWRLLVDGDGGDENLKDYPIEENPELTIGSVLNNRMLYQEGWGVGTVKHSRTYSGGQSRSYTRTYAPLARFGFEGFSPFTRPSVIEVAEGIPFRELTGRDPARLYALKGEVVARGVRAVTGRAMPVFAKRRFQEGAVAPEVSRTVRGHAESVYRSAFDALYR